MHKKIKNYLSNPFIKFKQTLLNSIHKSKSHKKILARSVFVGFLFSFTPLVGIQMYILAGYWAIAKKFKSLRFDYLPAFIILWISNFATLPFLYWIWYKTGIVILKIFGIVGFLKFNEFMFLLKEIIHNPQLNIFEIIIETTNLLLSKFGIPMMIGGIFQGIILGSIGYHITLKYLTHREKNKK